MAESSEIEKDREPGHLGDLPQEPVTTEAAEAVKGGATPPPSGPVPVPYPNLKPSNPRTIIPCI